MTKCARRVSDWSLVALLAALAGCQQQGSSSSETTEVQAARPLTSAARTLAALPDRDPALAKRLVEREGALLLDVRRDDEWQAGHVPGAAHLPVEQLEKRLGDVAQLTGGDKSKAIVVYCRSGARSARAKQILLGAGYPRVTNLGGLDDWPRD